MGGHVVREGAGPRDVPVGFLRPRPLREDAEIVLRVRCANAVSVGATRLCGAAALLDETADQRRRRLVGVVAPSCGSRRRRARAGRRTSSSSGYRPGRRRRTVVCICGNGIGWIASIDRRPERAQWLEQLGSFGEVAAVARDDRGDGRPVGRVQHRRVGAQLVRRALREIADSAAGAPPARSRGWTSRPPSTVLTGRSAILETTSRRRSCRRRRAAPRTGRVAPSALTCQTCPSAVTISKEMHVVAGQAAFFDQPPDAAAERRARRRRSLTRRPPEPPARRRASRDRARRA